MSLFICAIEESLNWEGQYSNDPLDNGGRTIYGVASKFWPQEFHEIYGLWQQNKKKEAQEIAKSFYRTHFWNSLYKQINDGFLIFKLFDFGINAGRRTAVKKLQKSVNLVYREYKVDKKIKVDGAFGHRTLNAINSIDGKILYDRYIHSLETYYRSLPTFFRFGRGWLNRLKHKVNLRARISINIDLHNV